MYDSIFLSLGNDIIKADVIFVINHFILASIGNNIIKTEMFFVMDHSTFKRDETGMVADSYNIDKI